MSRLDEFTFARLPEWLVSVAGEVDRMVRDTPTMERFRHRVREWKTEHDARGPTSSVDKDRWIQYNEVEILPVEVLTLAESYAALAAIHDTICERAERIDPWGIHGPCESVEQATAAISYAVLCRQVIELSDKHRNKVETALRDVQADVRLPKDKPALSSTPAADADGEGWSPPMRLKDVQAALEDREVKVHVNTLRNWASGKTAPPPGMTFKAVGGGWFRFRPWNPPADGAQ